MRGVGAASPNGKQALHICETSFSRCSHLWMPLIPLLVVQDNEQLPDEGVPPRADSDGDSHVRSEVDDDQEEVQRPQGSDDDEGEDLLEGAEGCAPLCLLALHAPRHQDGAASLPRTRLLRELAVSQRVTSGPTRIFTGHGCIWPYFIAPRLRRDYRPMPHLDTYDQGDIDDGELPEETFEQREAARLRAEAALDRADERAGRAGARRRLPGALEGALRGPDCVVESQNLHNRARGASELLLAAKHCWRCAPSYSAGREDRAPL